MLQRLVRTILPLGLAAVVGQQRPGRDTTTLFFAAGLNDEADGLFGSIQPA